MNALVQAARTLIGTPYHAHARLPGVGIDCIGVPIVAAWLSGVRPRTFDVTGYSMQPDGSMIPTCDQLLVRVPREAMEPGDVVIWRFQQQPHHVGVVGDHKFGRHSIIHAENYRHNKVIEHRLSLDGDWGGAFVAAYRFAELP